MTKQPQTDLDRLKKEVLAMGTLVEEAINRAIRALVAREPGLAKEVAAGDDAIDRKELEVEGMCLKMLALHQPVAGDLAGNIAERAQFLSTHAPLPVDIDFTRMVESVRRMVRQSLDALVNQDPDLARKVCLADEEVDGFQRHMFETLTSLMQRDSSTVERAVQVLSVSRHLERIGDSATNIAEDVVFMVEGDVIRHQPRGRLHRAGT
ncbi:MAG: phosphate transport system regulatory protein PhoU [Planctomycetes bacterium]|nr:phosphate transport system regulatory protein PhoU [Planctomycetota bacterium]